MVQGAQGAQGALGLQGLQGGGGGGGRVTVTSPKETTLNEVQPYRKGPPSEILVHPSPGGGGGADTPPDLEEDKEAASS